MNESYANSITVRNAIEDKLALLPDLPGCYIMKDSEDNILYIGKAKNLKHRVRSYFRGAHDSKTTKLVANIHHFETIVTHSNKEALILEINLIQEHKPPYNIKLKEGTMYPYLKITKERHPQLITTNRMTKDGGLYFGPFPDVKAANATRDLLRRAYPLRRCGRHEKRACFYYHIGQCIGPCDHEVPKEVYQAQIENIKTFLNGNVNELKNELKHKMFEASDKLDFEQAAEIRNQLQYIETTIERQNIMSKDYQNTDVIGFTFDKGWLSIQIFMLRQGSILKRETAIFPIMDEPEEEVASFIGRYYKEQGQALPKTIYAPASLDTQLLADILAIHVVTPQRGKKKSILDLCEKNSQLALDEHFRLIEANESKTIHAAQALAEEWQIPHAHRIESFDHSNIQGSHSVSGMVVYENGKANKSKYRKFKIKTIEGSNEFAHTQEIIRRRYTRLLKENLPLPDLILMDGGKIQIRAARDVLENELGLDIPVAGMVKDDKHKTAALMDGFNEEIIPLDPRSQAFHLVQRIQEEVHRFAISYHRQVRAKNQIASKLDIIEGVGPKTRTKLLKHFKSFEKIKQASDEELQTLGINRKIREALKEAFKE